MLVCIFDIPCQKEKQNCIHFVIVPPPEMCAYICCNQFITVIPLDVYMNACVHMWVCMCIYAHLQAHAYHRVHVKVRQEPLGIILNAFPPCLKQNPFAAEYNSLPGEQTSGDPHVSVLHLPCMGLQLLMLLSYSIHVHLMFTQQQNS